MIIIIITSIVIYTHTSELPSRCTLSAFPNVHIYAHAVWWSATKFGEMTLKGWTNQGSNRGHLLCFLHMLLTNFNMITHHGEGNFWHFMKVCIDMSADHHDYVSCHLITTLMAAWSGTAALHLSLVVSSQQWMGQDHDRMFSTLTAKVCFLCMCLMPFQSLCSATERNYGFWWYSGVSEIPQFWLCSMTQRILFLSNFLQDLVDCSYDCPW